MASRNISIRLDLYEKLEKIKDKNERFSDVIERLINEGLKGSPSCLMKHFGTWSDLSRDFDQIAEKIRKSMNESIDARLKERFNDLSGQ